MKMTKKRKYEDISEIIEEHLKPRLGAECNRLGIPESFIDGIYATFPKAFAYSSRCDPIEQDGKIVKVKIRLDSEMRSPFLALTEFWHEMRHAKDCYENRVPSEWRANLYVLESCLREGLIKLFKRSLSKG